MSISPIPTKCARWPSIVDCTNPRSAAISWIVFPSLNKLKLISRVGTFFSFGVFFFDFFGETSSIISFLSVLNNGLSLSESLEKSVFSIADFNKASALWIFCNCLVKSRSISVSSLRYFFIFFCVLSSFMWSSTIFDCSFNNGSKYSLALLTLS